MALLLSAPSLSSEEREGWGGIGGNLDYYSGCRMEAVSKVETASISHQTYQILYIHKNHQQLCLTSIPACVKLMTRFVSLLEKSNCGNSSIKECSLD
jgi:hypothetical protein